MLDGLRRELPLSRRDREGHREVWFVSLDEAADSVSATADPEAALIEAAQLARMRQALQRLAEHEQVIIMAIYDFGDEGSSGASLAEREGVSRSKVSRDHRRILDQLCQVLGGRHG
jgi:RNA polymerase sigma factor (sigma-70 family)